VNVFSQVLGKSLKVGNIFGQASMGNTSSSPNGADAETVQKANAAVQQAAKHRPPLLHPQKQSALFVIFLDPSCGAAVETSEPGTPSLPP
jgi:hypothetical protein